MSADFNDRMREEMEFHVERRAADLQKRGLPAGEARRRARIEFGSSVRYAEEGREAFGLALGDEFIRNLRYAARSLWSSKSYALAAIATLAICLGLNTTLLTVAEQALWRPLPYPGQDRLYSMVSRVRSSEAERTYPSLTGKAWFAANENPTGLDWAVYSDWASAVNFNKGSAASSVLMQRVSTGFFRVLGARLAQGREFTADEDRPNGPPAVILSHEFCVKALGGVSNLLGTTIMLRGESYSVVGVLAPGFQSTIPADVYTPLRPNTTGEGGGTNYRMVGRLKDPAKLSEATSSVAALSEHVLGKNQTGVTRWLELEPMLAGKSGTLRKPIAIFAGAAALVLLIGCLNIAGLSLSRFQQRRRELSTRVALGGGRGAIVRQLLTESLAVAAAGGAFGIVLGALGLEALKRAAPLSYGLLEQVRLDGRSLLISIAVTFATILLFGLWPAWRAAGLEVREGLASGSRGSSEGGVRWQRRVLILLQTAVALALLIQAGLLLRTFSSLMGLSPGFDPRNVMTARVSLDDARYHETEPTVRLFDRALDQLASQGLTDAAVSLSLPYERALNMGVRVPGREGFQTVNLHYVRGRYFETLKIPLLSGEAFPSGGDGRGEPVALINQALAKALFPSSEAIGQSVLSGNKAYRIIGITGDVQQAAGWGTFGPLAPIPAMYVRLTDVSPAALKMIHTWFNPALFARGASETVLRDALYRADPLLPVSKVRSMEEIRGQSASMQQFHALLFGLMAGVALILATLGLGGLIASQVARATRELGIRMALGARPRQAASTVVWPIAFLVLGGLAAGAGLARMGERVLEGLLYGVKPLDPESWLGAALLLLASAVVSLTPAVFRILRINPAAALREE